MGFGPTFAPDSPYTTNSLQLRRQQHQHQANHFVGGLAGWLADWLVGSESSDWFSALWHFVTALCPLSWSRIACCDTKHLVRGDHEANRIFPEINPNSIQSLCFAILGRVMEMV
jgi:hypothetical protein